MSQRPRGEKLKKMRKVGRSEKSNQNIVMNGQFVKNTVMNEQFVQNSVMNKSVDFAHKKIRSKLCAREPKTKKLGKIQSTFPASQLFSTKPPLEAVKALVSIMMSVSWSNKAKPLKLRYYDISTARF